MKSSHQLHSGLQLTGAAIKIRSCSADAAMASKCFQNVNGSPFVSKVCQKCSTSAVTASTLKSCSFVQQGERLRQAVCFKPCLDALLACKEWVAAIYTLGQCSVGLQFLAQLDVDENCTSVSALSHVG